MQYMGLKLISKMPAFFTDWDLVQYLGLLWAQTTFHLKINQFTEAYTYIWTAAARTAAAGCKLPESWSRETFLEKTAQQTLSLQKQGLQFVFPTKQTGARAWLLSWHHSFGLQNLTWNSHTLSPTWLSSSTSLERSGESTLLWMCSSGTDKSL